ncbi:MAG TPA: hypothetical protein PK760_13370 [Flavobacteriales bacterium]|nr:hypothetical protein [Flavobacteriales bacterium]
MSLRNAIAVLGIALSIGVFGQDPFVEALRTYQASDLTSARKFIDEAVLAPAHAEDPEAWLLRGFVYKDIFKASKDPVEADRARDDALNSLFRCIRFDKDSTYRDNAEQAYDFLAKSCYNEAAGALNQGDDVRALILFDKFEEAVTRLNAKADMRNRDLEFRNALGTLYTKRFNEDRTQLEWFDKATKTYKEVLKLDSVNYGANYNLATLYYNLGVYRIRAMQVEVDILTMQQIQQVARDLFQQALPYMLKAHEMNPSRKETLLGLEGIYYSLQDEVNSEKFRKLFEMLPQGGGDH